MTARFVFIIIIIVLLIVGLFIGLMHSRGLPSWIPQAMMAMLIMLLIGGLFSGFLNSTAAGCTTMVIFVLLSLILAMYLYILVMSCDPGRAGC